MTAHSAPEPRHHQPRHFAADGHNVVGPLDESALIDRIVSGSDVVVLGGAGAGKTRSVAVLMDGVKAAGVAVVHTSLKAFIGDMPLLTRDSRDHLTALKSASADTPWVLVLDGVDEAPGATDSIVRVGYWLDRELRGRSPRSVIWACRPGSWTASLVAAAQTELGRNATPEAWRLEPLSATEAESLAGALHGPDGAARVRAWVADRDDRSLSPLDVIAIAAANLPRGATRRDAYERLLAAQFRRRADPARKEAWDEIPDATLRVWLQRVAMHDLIYPTTSVQGAEGVDEQLASIVSEATAEQRKALLDLPVFRDGRAGLEFQLRSLQEFAASQWLLDTTRAGGGREPAGVRALLFDETGERTTLRPQLAVAAAWAATNAPWICDLLLEFEPELLLTEGDPPGLSVEVRSRAFEGFAARDAAESRLRLWETDTDLVRSAIAGLPAARVADILRGARQDGGTLATLLGWVDPSSDEIASVVDDMARSAALSEWVRESAVEALKRAATVGGNGDRLRELAAMVDLPGRAKAPALVGVAAIAGPNDVPLLLSGMRQVVQTSAPELVVSTSISSLLLARRLSDEVLREAARMLEMTLGREPYVGDDIQVNMNELELIGLADEVCAELIRRWDRLHDRGSLLPLLRTLIERIASTTHLHLDHASTGNDSIQRALNESQTARRELASYDVAVLASDPGTRPDAPATALKASTTADTEWVYQMALMAEGTAVPVWARVCKQAAGSVDAAIAAVAGRVGATDSPLLRALSRMHPCPVDRGARRRDRDDRRQRQDQSSSARSRLRRTLRERRRARNAVPVNLAETELDAIRQGRWESIAGFLRPIGMFRRGDTHLDISRLDAAAREAFGVGMRIAWRRCPVAPVTSRVDTSIPDPVIVALVSARVWASDSPDWSGLDSGDADLLAELGFWELNELPGWYENLAENWPASVESALRSALLSELTGNCVNVGSTVIDRAARRGPFTAACAAQALSELLADQVHLDVSQPPGELPTLYGALYRSPEALVAQLRCHATTNGAHAGWWTEWFWAAPSEAVTWLGSAASTRPAVWKESLLQSLSPRRGALDSNTAHRRIAACDPETLARLVEWAYVSIPTSADRKFGTAPMVTARDDAEETRDWLLTRLGEGSHRTPQTTLLPLLTTTAEARPEMVKRVMSHMRARAAAGLPPGLQLAPLEQGRVVPTDEAGLLVRIVADLEDVARAQSGGDFRYAEVFRRTEADGDVPEVAMQRWLADQLKLRSNGDFVVNRENELPTLGRPDIVATLQSGPQVRIEVKIAESWTLDRLRTALHDQLIGDYLGTDACRAGVLVLLNINARQRGWVTAEGRWLSFEDLVTDLRAAAAAVVTAETRVVAIDLSGE